MRPPGGRAHGTIEPMRVQQIESGARVAATRATHCACARLRANAAVRCALGLLFPLVSALAPAAVAAQPQEICRGSPAPPGWVETDLRWSATECGPGSPSSPNMVIIEQHRGRPAGQVMAVCAWAETPDGWVDVNRRWVATNRCVTNASPGNPNVKDIRRLQ